MTETEEMAARAIEVSVAITATIDRIQSKVDRVSDLALKQEELCREMAAALRGVMARVWLDCDAMQAARAVLRKYDEVMWGGE